MCNYAIFRLARRGAPDQAGAPRNSAPRNA